MKHEPILRTRREFLRSGILGGAMAWTVPSFLAHTFSALHGESSNRAIQTVTGVDGTILVVLQMAGGNDGVNTVVPYSDDHYHRARPRLALPEKRILKLNDTLGLHPSLEGLKTLHDAGHLAVVQGVGYPNPNRSHFRSTEIWQTASDADRAERHGWLGRYFDNACPGADPTVGVSVGRQMPQAFASRQPLGVSLDNPRNYRFMNGGDSRDGTEDSMEQLFRDFHAPEDVAGGEDAAGGSIGMLAGGTSSDLSPLDFLERTALDARVSSDRILEITRKATNQPAYPASQLANSLKLVSQLIGGGLSTRVYYVSQGGYDTHTHQAGAHERLLREMSDAVKAFVADLKAQGNFERVLIMTFSEFGRRVAENANGGTDHGAAAPLFVMGSRIKAGQHGTYPSLNPEELLRGDLKFSVDFRSVYAGVLEHWLKTPSEPVLGRAFAPLALV